jgi:hypothetical protein
MAPITQRNGRVDAPLTRTDRLGVGVAGRLRSSVGRGVGRRWAQGRAAPDAGTARRRGLQSVEHGRVLGGPPGGSVGRVTRGRAPGGRCRSSGRARARALGSVGAGREKRGRRENGRRVVGWVAAAAGGEGQGAAG